MLQLTIQSLKEICFQGVIEQVSLPGVLGRFVVQKNHAPLISLLTPGNLMITTSQGVETLPITSPGIAKVKNNHIEVLF